MSILQPLPSEEARNLMTGWFKKRLLGNNSVAECRAKRGVSRQPTGYGSGHLDTAPPFHRGYPSTTLRTALDDRVV